MKNMILTFGLGLFALCALNPQTAYAQDIPKDSTTQVSIQTTDGNEYTGYIVSQSPESISLKTETLGTLNIPRKMIKSIQRIRKEQIVAGEYWYDNPYATRYFFGPNGYGLRKGEGYYQNAWIFFNQVSYGISDNFTIGAGVIPLFLFNGTATPVWLTPKVSIPLQKNKVNLGVGGLFAIVAGEDNSSFGVAYGQLTLGPRDRNINFGLGYGYAGDDWANSPTVTISGTFRTSKKFALMTENYIFDTGDSNAILLSFGGRFIGRHVAIDAGLFIPAEGDATIAIPWLGINVPFGHPSYD